MYIYAFDLWGVTQDPSQPNLDKPRLYEPGAIESISKIVNSAGAENCYIVSLINMRYEDAHRRALHEDQILEKTGLLPENVKFLRYSLHNPSKAETIAKLKITHFVDDQLRFLIDVPKSVKRFWYNRQISLVDKMISRATYHATAFEYPFFNKWDKLYERLCE